MAPNGKHISGLVVAKSPAFPAGGGGKWVFLVALSSYTSLDSTKTGVFPIFVDCVNKEGAAEWYQQFRINDAVEIENVDLFKVSFGSQSKEYALKLVPTQSSVRIIGENEIYPVVFSSFLKAGLPTCSLNLISYEGIITKVDTAFLVLDDEIYLYIANPTQLQFAQGQKACFANLMETKLPACEGQVCLYFVPYFSSFSIDGKEKWYILTSILCTSAHFELCKSDITMHIQSLPLPADQLPTALSFFDRTTNIISAFTGMFKILPSEIIHKVSPLADLVSCAKLIPSKHGSLRQYGSLSWALEEGSVLIGIIEECPVSGLLKIRSVSGDVLFHCNTRVTLGSLVVVKKGELIVETFMVDAVVSHSISRIYLKALDVDVIPNSPNPSLALLGEYDLIFLDRVAIPQLIQASPPVMEGDLVGYKIGVLLCSASDLEIKAHNKSLVRKHFRPSTLLRHPSIQPGNFVLIKRRRAEDALSEDDVQVVGIELNDNLAKGKCTLDQEKRTLHVSRMAYRHFTDAQQTSDEALSIGTVLNSKIGAPINFRGVLLAVDLVEFGPKKVIDGLSLKLFKLFSIGLPNSTKCLKLVIGDEIMPDAKTEVVYDLAKRWVMPLGLINGIIVEGFQFRWQDGVLVSTGNSRLKIGFEPPFPLHTPVSSFHFHHLSDFVGFPERYPKKPVLIRCSLFEICKLQFSASCTKCDSPLSKSQCPIHRKDFTGNIIGQLQCSITDGTFLADLILEDALSIFVLLKVEGIHAERWTKSLYELGSYTYKPRASLPTNPPQCSVLDEYLQSNRWIFKQARFLVKGTLLEAIPVVRCANQLVVRRYQVGRQQRQALAPPGNIAIRGQTVNPINWDDETRTFLKLLGM